MITDTRDTAPATEMSLDLRFKRRLQRLVVVSLVFLGAIALLAWTMTDTDGLTVGLLAAGWVLMPTLLYASVANPRLRYLLAIPATLVTVGLLRITLGDSGGASSLAGWWLITAGIVMGGSLGAWFWYRWMPVPAELNDPFSRGRWALIALHAGLVVVGIVMVLAT